ncbi:MAG: hypothetical protein U1E65_06840 [Myxococcota bacterium]
MTHTDFARAFQAGLVIDRGFERLELKPEELGTLTVGPEGLWVFDPGFDRVDPPIDSLTHGKYLVTAAVVEASAKEGGGARRVVAALRAALTGSKVVRWVDQGTVSCDGGWIAMSTRADTEALTPEDEAVLHTTGPEIASCLAGYGDGGYGVFLGFDAADRAVACAVDFFVLVSPRELVVPLPTALSPGPLRLPALEALGVALEVPPPGTMEDGQAVVLVLDASRRVSPEVTSFELRAFDAGGGQLFVGYSAQGDRWSFTKPDGAVARMEVFLQAGVEAL